VGLLDTILGRSKPVRANLDALFALPTAALTLQRAGGLVSSGHAGVCWKPPPGQGSADAQKEILELVGDDSGFRHSVDSFDYGWLLLDDPDLEELVTKIHMANSTLQDNGWGPQLLCSVFGFVPAPGPDTPDDARAFRLVYLYKRGTFYPFAPVDAGKERRDTELELRIRSMVGTDLPVETDLTRWFPMWDMPVSCVGLRRGRLLRLRPSSSASSRWRAPSISGTSAATSPPTAGAPGGGPCSGPTGSGT